MQTFWSIELSNLWSLYSHKTKRKKNCSPTRLCRASRSPEISYFILHMSRHLLLHIVKLVSETYLLYLRMLSDFLTFRHPVVSTLFIIYICITARSKPHGRLHCPHGGLTVDLMYYDRFLFFVSCLCPMPKEDFPRKPEEDRRLIALAFSGHCQALSGNRLLFIPFFNATRPG